MKKIIIVFILSLVTFGVYADDRAFVTHVTLTTYNAVQSQCNSDPLTTADGTKIDLNKLNRGELRYAAVSRDLLWAIPYGSIIHIEGHGEYEVRDTMNERFNHSIDILQPTSKKNFKKEKIKVTLIRKGKLSRK